MPGSPTAPGRPGACNGAPVRIAFHQQNDVGTQIDVAFAAQWLAYAIPYRRFAAHPHGSTDARLGADVVCYSFIVVDLHHLLLAGLPAHSAFHPLRTFGASTIAGSTGTPMANFGFSCLVSPSSARTAVCSSTNGESDGYPPRPRHPPGGLACPASMGLNRTVPDRWQIVAVVRADSSFLLTAVLPVAPTPSVDASSITLTGSAFVETGTPTTRLRSTGLCSLREATMDARADMQKIPWSGLQLALQFIEKAPIRVLGNDPLWLGLDEPRLVQPQRVEAHGILGIVIAPNSVGQLLQRSKGIIIPRREPLLDHQSGHSFRFVGA